MIDQILGMTIKVKIICFFSLMAILLTALFADLWFMLDNARQLNELQVNRYISRELVEELRRSSDDLTRMARTYVVTGEQSYLDYYYQIVDIRDGRLPRPENYQDIYWDYVSAGRGIPIGSGRKVPLIELMREQNFASDEILLLAEAKKHSDKLIEMEVEAFNAAQGLFPDASGSYSRSGVHDRERALQILHGEAYHQAKAEIMVDVDAVFKHLENRTKQEVTKGEARQNHPLILAIFLSLVLLCMSIAGYRIFITDVSRPLNKILGWVNRMQQGDYSFDQSSFKKDELGKLSQAFIGMAAQVSGQIDALEMMSLTDPLTRINNRIALDKALSTEMYTFERYETPCAVIMLDVDHFKKVNDVYGHIVGDRVLVEIAGFLKRVTRESDIVGRWGGEEFLVICPNTGLDGSRSLAELIRQRINDHHFAEVGSVTVSLGVSIYEHGRTIEQIIDRADQKLYQAKKEGRNRVCS